MTTSKLREKLHNYLEVADETKIKAIYTLMEEEIEETLVEYSNELKKELDVRLSDYQSGKIHMVNEVESKLRIEKILDKKNKQ